MSAAQWAYAGYLGWLLAGAGDFACHRRTAIERTSGRAESLLHLLQLAVIGAAVLAWLLCSPSLGLLAVLGGLAAAHALLGYADTRVAYGLREIRPFEQHLHSVLDMAPWIALAAIAAVGWRDARVAGWGLALRPWRDADAALWLALLVPALVLCVLPALSEFARSSWPARESRPPPETSG